MEYFNGVIVKGNEFLGIFSRQAKDGVNTETSKFDCFASITPGDIIAYDQKIAAATFGVTRDSCVIDIVIDLCGKSNVRPYLLDQESALTPANLSIAAGKGISLNEAVSAYRRAFDRLVGISYEPVTPDEATAIGDLILNKYTNDDWNFKQWRAQ
jgi:lipoate-protein ligase A